MSADLSMTRRALRIVAILMAASGSSAQAIAGDAEDPARIRRAIAYLDGRQDEWQRFARAQRGEGADRTACVSCHTGVGYALARPSLRPFATTPGPAEPERRMVAVASLRVEHWAGLDSPRFELMYDRDDRKKAESRGTEAVLNALILARDDASNGRAEPGAATRAALTHLWAAQAREGGDAGSWDWLNFGLGPWEANGSRTFGASLAAIAVGSAPAYLDRGLDETTSRGVRSLRDYLRRRFPEESLYNRLWILEASTTFQGLLSTEEGREVVNQLQGVRREDGGWSLATLGDFKRLDGSAQSSDSDGHATGLVVRAMHRDGTPSARQDAARGLDWIRSHQQDDGSWRGRSLNKDRDATTFVGRLMSDAATAQAALALVEAGSK